MPDIQRAIAYGRRLVLECTAACILLPALASIISGAEPLRANFDELLRQLPKLQQRPAAQVGPEVADTTPEDYEKFAREKFAGQWFAALVPHSTPPSFHIIQRFDSWSRFMDFLQEHDAIVDVWASGDAGNATLRRLPAAELAALKKAPIEQPTILTITYRRGTGPVVTNRVEFGLNAAKTALAANQAYLQHRRLQRRAHEILSTRDETGLVTAQSQWENLSQAVLDGDFRLASLPAQPGRSNDLFVAFEYEVDSSGNFTRSLQVFRESDLQHKIVYNASGEAVQVLTVKKRFDQHAREAWGYRRGPVGGSLLPAANPIRGQDDVELRIRNPAEPDVEKWNAIEFGEPDLMRESALAQFSLISAHLERQRKQVALKRSNLDLIAEPIFLGLSLGGGVTGVPFPIGSAARLGYNALVVPHFIPEVPTVKQLRELLLLLAAREKHPEIKLKPHRFLSGSDLRILQETAGQISESELREYVQRVSDDDLKAMLSLARLQEIDARVSNLLAIFTDAAKVSSASEAGVLRKIFNSPYFSVTGDISLKTLIAVSVGERVATPLSGVSLENLSQGKGPVAAWLQYLDVTVDFRAVMNTAHRLGSASLADKELKKPFPYAPRLSDLAAYEIRIFGFPLLIWHKRGLLKNDIAAFDSDYAYGLLGATIVEHFKTRSEMDEEIRAGTMVPLGYVLIPDKKLGWRESNLAKQPSSSTVSKLISRIPN